jgi:asparagine synthase (glutamine-hydrolysing)
VGDYLNGITEDKANTFYLNIHRLPPAHSLTVAAIGTQLQSYWSLESTADLRLSSDEEYSGAFHDVFRDAVRCRMRSAFPRGSHLSGGLDSSAVTCMARELCDRPDAAGWHTFSNVFDDVPECDESPFINAVLAQGGYIPHYVHPDRSSPLADLERVFWHQDEPAIGPNHFLPWELNKATAQAGVRVVLDGFDGDSTVSHGAFRLAELANSGQWETFANEAKAVSQHFKVSPIGLLQGYGLKSLENLARRQRWVAFVTTINQLNKVFQLSRRDLIWKYGLGPLIPANLFGEGRKERKSGDRVHPVIDSQFAREVGLRERNHSVNGTQADHSYTVREDQLRTLTSGLFTSVLEMSDRCAAAFGIEVRHPFMDKRLVEFCLSLPSEQKLKGGWGRIVMRRALHNILPEEVQWRGGKTDMNPNFLRGFLRIDQEAVRQVIGSLSGLIEKYIDMGALHTIYQRLADGRKVKIDDAMIMWKVTTLAYWLRQARFGLSGSLT